MVNNLDTRRPDIDWANLPPQGWVFDGNGGMRMSKLARMRAWLWWFSGTKLGALLYVLLGTCAVYAVCCWFHVVVR
jgi:hypothetical protein